MGSKNNKYKNYIKIYEDVKENFIETFSESKNISILFEGSDFVNVNSDWFKDPSKPEANTINFVKSLLNKCGVNPNQIIEEKKLSRDKTEYFKKFTRFPDMKILKGKKEML